MKQRAVRKPEPIEITDEEREELERLARRPRTHRSVSFRARVILLSSAGVGNVDIAKRLHCAPATVWLWRKRFFAKRVKGLYDEPRPGSGRKLADDEVERLIVATLESKPKGA